MRIKTIPSKWLQQEGRRLDCGPYMSGALEAKIRLAALPYEKVMLRDLTAGREGGIYNGPHFSRNFVESTKYGVPFLGSSAMLRADLSGLPLLRRRDAISSKLSFLRLSAGMTLISCSGTIGRMVYARPDMEHIWTSQHIMKVVPDPAKVPPGYVYAFLSSKFGLPIVVSGTYGSIIQSIEPQHIANLPVPRLGDELEGAISERMDESAKLVARYQALVCEATDRLFAAVGFQDVSTEEWHATGRDLGFPVQFPRHDSLRALNFNPRFEALKAQIKEGPWRALGEICIPGTLTRGGRFKRIDADPEYSLRLVGQKHLFWLQPEGRWIARFALGADVTVDPGTVLIAAQGTLGENELYSRAEFAWGPGVKLAYSEHILRAKADEDVMPRGCLFAFLRSETAFRMLRSISVGSKLQDHHHMLRAEIPVPYPPKDVQQQVHKLVVDAYDCRHRGVALENEARSLVERAIDEVT